MKPTAKQLAYLRELATLSGQPVPHAATRAHASAQIAQLQTRAPTDRDPVAPQRRRLPVVGRRMELARYELSAGGRVVYGQRIDGAVRVIDAPADPGGRSFLVERGITSTAELDALVVEYVADSTEHDRPAALGTGELADV